MFNPKTEQRGAQKRETLTQPVVRKERITSTHLKLVLIVLIGLCFLSGLLLWKPWVPVSAISPEKEKLILSDKERLQLGRKLGETHYDFYDQLPTQQVRPIVHPDMLEQEQALNAESNTKPDTATQTGTQSETQKQTPKIQVLEPKGYILQINSFNDPEEADELRDTVMLAGVNAEVIMMRDDDDRIWYRVFAGTYRTKKQADDAMQQLQNSGIDALIVGQF